MDVSGGFVCVEFVAVVDVFGGEVGVVFSVLFVDVAWVIRDFVGGLFAAVVGRIVGVDCAEFGVVVE